jgi:hypothetical protein
LKAGALSKFKSVALIVFIATTSRSSRLGNSKLRSMAEMSAWESMPILNALARVKVTGVANDVMDLVVKYGFFKTPSKKTNLN